MEIINQPQLYKSIDDKIFNNKQDCVDWEMKTEKMREFIRLELFDISEYQMNNAVGLRYFTYKELFDKIFSQEFQLLIDTYGVKEKKENGNII